MGFVDWNVAPEELDASGLLDGLGLEVVIPTNSIIVCTACKGSMIDDVTIAKGFRS